MRITLKLLLAVLTLSSTAGAQGTGRLNTMIDLLEARKPIFGLYAPSNPRRRPGTPAPATPDAPLKAPALLAAEALAAATSDFIFDGSMEGDFDAAFPGFAQFAQGAFAAGALEKMPYTRLRHPLVVKTHEIAPDVALATGRIGRQLNLGVSAIVFVGVESAEEVKQGLAAMRFKSNGGARAEDAGTAPAYWGMSEKAYKEKADVWPLNPKGELVNWTIVESKEGLAHVREIAAVKGIGVLFPGAGTLRGVFTTTDASGQRIFDEKGWEASIQQVLAACKEFNVPCGYPATSENIEMRMQQGFSVFVINWGEAGQKAIDIGRRIAGR